MSISLKQKAVFFRQLATLSEASVPVLRSLEILKRQIHNPQLKKIIEDLESSISKGASISDVISKHKSVFTSFEIQLIKSGEENGTLPVRLTNLASYLENIYNIRLKIISSLLYPFILINAGLLIPPVIQAASKGVDFYIKTAGLNLLMFYGAVIVIYFVCKFLKSNPNGDAFLSGFILGIPLVGGINYKLSLAGYLANFAELNDAGITITRANELAAETVSNIIIRKKLLKISEHIKSGEPLTTALEKTKLFDDMSLGMIAAGEEAGNIGASCKKAAQYLDKEANQDIIKVMVILPSLIFILLAIYFGYVIITFYMNYFNNIFKILEPQ